MPGISVRPFMAGYLLRYGSIGVRGPTYLLDLLKEPVSAVQAFFLVAGQAFRNIFRRSHYGDVIALQMDTIGVGSLQIVAITGFFSGAVMALQMYHALAQYGQMGRSEERRVGKECRYR